MTKITAIKATPARAVEGPTVSEVLSRLDRVRPTRRGWSARCPAHPDRSPSLSIAPRADGGVLLHCFATCQRREILAAVGLEDKGERSARLDDREPVSVHALALCLARRQRWADPLVREGAAIASHVRALYRATDQLRRAATASGETPGSWDALTLAARYEREALRIEHALDEALA